MLSFTDSSAIAHDAERLRRSAEESGYLFFRGLVAPAAVGALRDQVVPRCEKHGWLARGGAPDPVAFLAEVLSLPAFVALGDDPAILAVLSRIFQGPVATRCGDVCRVVSPESPESATPPHQDQFYVRGAANLWTVWVPLGDCPRTLGGLAILPGSHRAGLLAHSGGAGHPAPGSEPDARWATTDYRAGDVLMFGSLTVHGACPNLSGNRLRLSVDYRYRPAIEAVSDFEEMG